MKQKVFKMLFFGVAVAFLFSMAATPAMADMAAAKKWVEEEF